MDANTHIVPLDFEVVKHGETKGIFRRPDQMILAKQSAFQVGMATTPAIQKGATRRT